MRSLLLFLLLTISLFGRAEEASQGGEYFVSLYFDLPPNSNTCDDQYKNIRVSTDVEEKLKATNKNDAIKEAKSMIGTNYTKEFGNNCLIEPKVKRKPLKNKKIIGFVLQSNSERRGSQSLCKTGVVKDFRVPRSLEECKENKTSEIK